MEEIVINLSIDKGNNITVENSKTKKNFIIEYTSKILSAQDVYEVFNFEKGNNYNIKSDIEKVTDERIKEYYADIINLFDDIKKELNELVVNED